MKENNTMNTNIDKQEKMNYGPTQADLTHHIRKNNIRYAELTEQLKPLPTKAKGTLQMVQERSICAVDNHFLHLGYYPMSEIMARGPIDRMYYKIDENGNPKFWNVDVKGINPNANYKPAFKPRADKKFIARDKAVKRIVAIEYNGRIEFVEGWHENYKNLKSKRITINE